ncbi:hypothetical protein G9F71_000840 [Clostridium sp. FP2]|uniref:hypothetical protein n=1 Tax=Clostridium sp. FP2 TaxID=2724481 RepID=UPI0013E96169|nr:hypothetical protein [Clostridium sp. FP2]MBZ9621438.1 hypothetical protein [Clostridium sp. FP2]
MDKFTKQIEDLISEEVGRRAEKIVMERLNCVAKSLATCLSINDIAWAIDLSVVEVRGFLQETVDIKNNILKLCGEADNMETIESFFNLDKLKIKMETTKNIE